MQTVNSDIVPIDRKKKGMVMFVLQYKCLLNFWRHFGSPWHLYPREETTLIDLEWSIGCSATYLLHIIMLHDLDIMFACA